MLDSDELLLFCILRDKAANFGKTEKIPRKLAVQLSADMKKWLELQRKIYKNELNHPSDVHPDPVDDSVQSPFNLLEDGLNLKYECKNVQCSTFQKEIYIHKNFGELNLGKEEVSDCPTCRTENICSLNPVFLKNCSFGYQAVDDLGNQVIRENQLAQEIPFTINMNHWKFCVIKTAPLDALN